MATEIPATRAAFEAALESLKRGHTECEDPFYACPKSFSGCCDDRQGPDCNCGADETNDAVDNLMEALRRGVL